MRLYYSLIFLMYKVKLKTCKKVILYKGVKKCMENIKENYELMFTEYPDIVNIVQLKEMLGIGSNLAYKLVRDKTIPSLKVGREYKIPKRNIICYLMNQN